MNFVIPVALFLFGGALGWLLGWGLLDSTLWGAIFAIVAGAIAAIGGSGFLGGAAVGGTEKLVDEDGEDRSAS